jgi:hypothetical protein
MKIWWKRIANGSKRVERGADEFIELYGEQAAEMARLAAVNFVGRRTLRRLGTLLCWRCGFQKN